MAKWNCNASQKIKLWCNTKFQNLSITRVKTTKKLKLESTIRIQLKKMASNFLIKSWPWMICQSGFKSDNICSNLGALITWHFAISSAAMVSFIVGSIFHTLNLLAWIFACIALHECQIQFFWIMLLEVCAWSPSSTPSLSSHHVFYIKLSGSIVSS